MRMTISFHGEELNLPHDHPLNDHIVSVFAWRYVHPYGDQPPSSGAHITVQSTRRRRKGEGRAISVSEAPFSSHEQVQSVCDALNTRDGTSLFTAIQPFLPKPKATKPKAPKPPKGTRHNFSGQQEPPTPSHSPFTHSTPIGKKDSTTGTGKNSTIGKKRGRRKKSITMDDTQASHPTSQNDPPTEVRKNRRRST